MNRITGTAVWQLLSKSLAKVRAAIMTESENQI